MIRVFDGSGEVADIVRFNSGGQYLPAAPSVSIAVFGPRGTTLGTNM